MKLLLLNNHFMQTTLVILVSLYMSVCIPLYAFAQLSSENYVVEGVSVGSSAVTLNATSAAYDADAESGSLYIINEDTPIASNPSGSSGSGVKTVEHSALLLGPVSATLGEPVRLALRVLPHQDGVAYPVFTVESSGVRFQPVVSYVGNGVYIASYTSRIVGTDRITVTFNGKSVVEDTDGQSDGVLNVLVTQPAVQNTQSSTPQPPLPTQESPIATGTPGAPTNSDTYQNTDSSAVDFGLTARCYRAFTWSVPANATIYKSVGDTPEVELVRISKNMPWFIDTDVRVLETTTYRFVFAGYEKEAVVTFTQAELEACVQEEVGGAIEVDIDADGQLEQYIDGIFQDSDGSTVPLSVTADGLLLDTDADGSADLFWNPLKGTSPVIVGVDRIFIVDKAISPVQEYIPADVRDYRVGLETGDDGKVIVTYAATVLLAFPQSFAYPTIALSLLGLLVAMKSLGLLAGFVPALFSLFNVPFAVTNLGRLLLEARRFLFGPLTFWKKFHPWGTVYDSVTKAPVDPAYVELFDGDGVQKAEAITDLDGRYGFLVPPGNYTLAVRKVNYTFPSTHRSLTPNDVLYTNLYYGGPLVVSETVAADVPMDPVGFDWNQYEKMRTKQTAFIHRIDPYIAYLFDALFYGGACIAVWQFITVQDVFSTTILVCYTVLGVVRFYRGKPPLYGRVEKNGIPVAYGLVRVYREQREFMTKVTDAYGRYIAIVPKGHYRVSVEERIDTDMYTQVYETSVNAKKGYINKHIRLS
jgi:hypothetical protein